MLNYLLGFDETLRTLFRRCVTCPETPPSCPPCAADEKCSLSMPSCTSCPSAFCAKSDDAGGLSSSSGKKANIAGAIAGGVIGGIAVICLTTWLVWRFCIKKRRQEFDEQDWPEDEKRDTFATERSARNSTHTVQSIASTAYTRASNIIQIAYIPGVTNRSVESSPDLLVPPVPPIPAGALSNSTHTSPHLPQDQHYFMPSDLRDSQYSAYTEDNRASYQRKSMAPSLARSSLASTMYRNNAVINPVPAQTITRGKATAVSVRSNGVSGRNSPNRTPSIPTPPVPSLSPPTQGQTMLNTNSPIVARVGTPKTVNVTRSQSFKQTGSTNTGPVPNIEGERAHEPLIISTSQPDPRISITAPSRHSPDSSTFDDPSSDEEDLRDAARQSLMGHDHTSASASMGTVSEESPFKTPSSTPELGQSRIKVSLAGSKQKHRRSGSLNQIIQEATRRASREPRHGGLGSVGSLRSWRTDSPPKRDGPFSDANVARTPSP